MKLKFIGSKNYKLEANEDLKVVVKTFLCTFFSIIFISGFEVNAKTDISLDKGANPFVPKEVLSNYFKSSQKQKMSYCSSSGSNAQDQVIRLSKMAPKRLKGFNSRMDNRDRVEGAKVLDEFSLRMSELMTSSWAIKNNNQQEIALEALWNWAKSDALLATYNCKDGGDPECQKYWERSDGQDLSPSLDHSKSQMEVMHMAYAYFLTLSSFKPTDNRHAVIQNWFRKFSKRNKPPAKGDDLGFGLDFGWNWPAIFFGHLESESQYSGHEPKKLLISLVKKIDELILQDGSIQNRTTRGNRALWYHLSALAEITITLEMARSFDVPVPKSLDRRLELSFELFVRGFENHSYMDQWAKVAYNSVYEAGVQVFRNTLDIPNGNSAFYIFMFRNPDSPITKILKKHLFPYKALARMDGYIGIGLGCIYGVAQEVALSLSEVSEVTLKRRNETFPGISDNYLKYFSPDFFQFKKATSLPHKYENRDLYEAVWFEINNVQFESYKKYLVGFKLMLDYESLDKQQNRDVKHIRLSIGDWVFPDALDYVSLTKCHHSTINTRDEKVVSLRVALGDNSERSNCTLAALTEKNRSLLIGLASNLREILEVANNAKDIAGIDRNDEKLAEVALIIASRFGAIESSPKRVKLKVREEKYDRTKSGIEIRFKCLTDFATVNDITGLPSPEEIATLINSLNGNDYYRSHRQLVKAGISKEAMDTNKKALVRLVNFEGTNEEYCAKPVL